MAVCMNYFGIDGEAWSLVAIVFAIDTITWVTAAAVDIERRVLSRTMIRGVLYKLMMFGLVLAISASWRIMDMDMWLVIDVVLATLILSELYSIIGNIYNIKTKKNFPENESVDRMFVFVLEFINKKIDSILPDKKQ